MKTYDFSNIEEPGTRRSSKKLIEDRYYSLDELLKVQSQNNLSPFWVYYQYRTILQRYRSGIRPHHVIEMKKVLDIPETFWFNVLSGLNR